MKTIVEEIEKYIAEDEQYKQIPETDLNYRLFLKYSGVNRKRQEDGQYYLMEMGTVTYMYDGNEPRKFYIAELGGGNNGHQDWIQYLNNLNKIITRLSVEYNKVWVVKLEIDCLDDVHTVLIGFKNND